MLLKEDHDYKAYKHSRLSKNGNVYSIQYKNKVLTHKSDFVLKNCKLIVSQSGRNRVIKNKVKNVHAFIVGQFTNKYVDDLPFSPIFYNPYITKSFELNGVEIYEATYVKFSKQGVSVYV